MVDKEHHNGWDAAITGLKAFAARDDFFDAVALATKKQYDALVRAGFSAEQATQFVAAMASKPDK